VPISAVPTVHLEFINENQIESDVVRSSNELENICRFCLESKFPLMEITDEQKEIYHILTGLIVSFIDFKYIVCIN